MFSTCYLLLTKEK